MFDSASYTASGISGNLTLEQDAAHVNLGGNWRMPTETEYRELLNKCNVVWTNNYNGTGVKGCVFTSKINGNSVFFPAASYCFGSGVDSVGSDGNYWSASMKSAWAWYFDFTPSTQILSDNFGYYGYSVRGVCE